MTTRYWMYQHSKPGTRGHKNLYLHFTPCPPNKKSRYKGTNTKTAPVHPALSLTANNTKHRVWGAFWVSSRHQNPMQTVKWQQLVKRLVAMLRTWWSVSTKLHQTFCRVSKVFGFFVGEDCRKNTACCTLCHLYVTTFPGASLAFGRIQIRFSWVWLVHRFEIFWKKTTPNPTLGGPTKHRIIPTHQWQTSLV